MRIVFCCLLVLALKSVRAQPHAAERKARIHTTTPSAVVAASSTWMPFQVDEHLELRLPAPARLVDVAPQLGHTPQAYLAETKRALYLIMRVGLTKDEAARLAAASQETFYTSITQSMLTHLHAVRVNQSAFRVSAFEGLAVRFRPNAPTAEKSAGGILWALRLGTSVYLMNCLAKDSVDAELLTQQNQFIASMAANDALYTPPTAADWNKFRLGRFRYLSPASGLTTLDRSDSTQIEFDVSRNLRIVYSLQWTPEGYDITQLFSSSQDKMANFMQGKPIRVRITAVDGDTYSYSSFLEGFIITGKLQKLK